MERLWRHVQCSIPAEVIILRIAAGLIPMPQPPSFDDEESDDEDLCQYEQASHTLCELSSVEKEEEDEIENIFLFEDQRHN